MREYGDFKRSRKGGMTGVGNEGKRGVRKRSWEKGEEQYIKGDGVREYEGI